MRWEGVVGHQRVAATLRRDAEAGALAHAILLSGPEGVGKTTLALALAADVLGGDAWPGGLGAHPDFWLEDSPMERIPLDRVKPGGGTPEGGPSLQDFMLLRPYAGGARVAVLGRADRLMEQAANCVLKTLEEPPPRTHIVLCAAHPERMPATILSRCRQLALAPVAAGELSGWLRDAHGVEPARAATAAALSGGRPGRALSLATEPGVLRQDLEALDVLLRAPAAAPTLRGAALAAAAAVAPASNAEGRERAIGQVAAWTGFVRDAALIASGAGELAVWEPYAEAARAWADALGPRRLTDLLGRLVDSTDRLSQYASPRLTYEVLFLDILTGDPAPPRVDPPAHADLGPAGTTTRPTATTSRRPARRR
ncbi:MAG TPA: AAA family ATPase [Candidatus Dormibacteraeota bacterium]|nr:AAA family ATPase [Candidatus Dormibacteraeota bacterium]